MPRASKGTRQKLIETATELIWTASYGSVSVDDICTASGVKKGSFYHFFPSKQALAIEAMEEYYATEIDADMVRIFAANIPFPQQVEGLVDAILDEQRRTRDRYGRVCGCPMAALGSELIGQEDQAIVAKMEELFQRLQAHLVQAIQAANTSGQARIADPADKTRKIHDFITGLMMMARIHNSLDGLERDLKPGLFHLLGLDQKEQTQKKA